MVEILNSTCHPWIMVMVVQDKEIQEICLLTWAILQEAMMILMLDQEETEEIKEVTTRTTIEMVLMIAQCTCMLHMICTILWNIMVLLTEEIMDKVLMILIDTIKNQPVVSEAEVEVIECQ